MPLPKAEQQLIPVPGTSDLRKLLAACADIPAAATPAERKRLQFEALRDSALLRLMAGCGLRPAFIRMWGQPGIVGTPSEIPRETAEELRYLVRNDYAERESRAGVSDERDSQSGISDCRRLHGRRLRREH
jgi:hypothetical protein